MTSSVQSDVAAAPLRSAKRDISGLLLLDKPSGISSNGALQRVKRIYRARKAGHTGSLDPLATGVLPICFGEATKLSGFLLDADKRYRVVGRLGIVTTTGDAEGEILSRGPVPPLAVENLNAVLNRFSGEIQQIPPMHSALKHQGQPLYKLAHRGIEVERAPRSVTIYSLQLRALDLPLIELDVHCSKGTYIRTLIEDIGTALGCGAHVATLRRLQSGPFELSEAVGLAELEAGEGNDAALLAHIRPSAAVLPQWPTINVSTDMAFFLRRGQAVRATAAEPGAWVRMICGSDDFLGLGEIGADGRLYPRRLLNR